MRLLSLVFLISCTAGLGEEHWRLAQLSLEQGQHLRAVEEFSRVINADPQSVLAARAQMQIASIYEEQLRDFPRAIRAYVDVLRRSKEAPVKLKAHWAIARIYYEQLGDASTAADEYKIVYENYAKNDPTGPDILLAWAKALMDAARFREAAQIYLEFLNKYPAHKAGPRIALERGQALLADRRADEATTCFREFLTRYSKLKDHESMVSEAYFGLGSALEMGGDLNSALEAYRQSLTTYPNKKVIELKIESVMKRKKEKKV